VYVTNKSFTSAWRRAGASNMALRKTLAQRANGYGLALVPSTLLKENMLRLGLNYRFGM
jgi:hypothetical protein